MSERMSERMSELLQMRPEVFAEQLLTGERSRVMLLAQNAGESPRVSSPEFAGLADFFARDQRDYRDHEAVFLGVGPESRALFGVFIHKTDRGQAQGGVRNSPYHDLEHFLRDGLRLSVLEHFLRDGLRLSVGMGRKCALADLWWAGGKGIIAAPGGANASPNCNPELRECTYREFAQFVTSLRGAYITAEDAGTTPADMEVIYRHTRFATCIPESVGGSGNPSAMTACGVVRAMEAALDFRGLGDLEGKQIAMQGGGNVGTHMIELLFDKGAARVVVAELADERCAELMARFPSHFLEIRKVEPGDQQILGEACDIFCPNALGGVLNPKSIESIRAPIVCGAANNPLLDERRDARRLSERGITYVPDYVANRMGIVACSNEQAGSLRDDPLVLRHLEGERGWENSIYNVTQRILRRAAEAGLSSSEAAEELAEARAHAPHPIWGRRTREIIESLWDEGWAQAPAAASSKAPR
ncbi:MAG: Glu/Leu/Phe/Val dehydrogenase [Deltaproteobacteria bacterium]|nr:Glu/Leu/Phe/Val dehydrogenase [Deltaproteobacteria bacterium]